MLNRVKMLKTQMGVPDGGIYPSAFVEGHEYEIGDHLLQSFIDLGAVELAGDGDKAGEKSLSDAPANKMKKAAPENKAR